MINKLKQYSRLETFYDVIIKRYSCNFTFECNAERFSEENALFWIPLNRGLL